MGFNSINLDSKPWEDFFARYRGESASQYVGMQEFMMEQAHALGMGHSFLAIYLNGDNLYPVLRKLLRSGGAAAEVSRPVCSTVPWLSSTTAMCRWISPLCSRMARRPTGSIRWVAMC